MDLFLSNARFPFTSRGEDGIKKIWQKPDPGGFCFPLLHSLRYTPGATRDVSRKNGGPAKGFMFTYCTISLTGVPPRAIV